MPVMLLDRTSYMTTASIVLFAVAALGIAEKQGLTRAIPGIRTAVSTGSATVQLLSNGVPSNTIQTQVVASSC